mmetsp:Transcript_13302/g.32568  ORF Transcript_13302/g.32568 Transcript_13302/m.32568 type:complete len:241 (-) Transcript_13302:1651-2373(-)
MDLHDAHQSRVDVTVLTRLQRVVDLHRVGAPGDREDLRVEEITGKLLGVEGGGGDDQLEIGAALERLFEKRKQDVGGHGALVRLVEHDEGVPLQIWVLQHLAHQHTVRHILDHGVPGSLILKPDAVTHFLAEATTELLRDTLRDRHSGNTTRLGAANNAARSETCFRQVLRDLRGFSASRFSNHHQYLVVNDRVQQRCAQFEDGQSLPLLLDRFGGFLPHRHRVLRVQLLPLRHLVAGFG